MSSLLLRHYYDERRSDSPFWKNAEITTEIDGQVWECTVPTSRAEQYSETLNISNLRNIENNCTVLRVISEQSPMEMR